MNNGKIYLAAGGTGGHVFPALAVAEAINAKGYQSVLFTDQRGAKILADMDKLPVSMKVISAASPFQSGLLRQIIAVTKLGLGTLSCLWYIATKRPNVMIGFGGYPSFAPLIVADLFNVPVMVHEQNAFLGRANYAIATRAKVLALSWPQTKNLPDGVQTRVTGMPVRTAFFVKKSLRCKHEKLVLTVLGGSQGASILGNLVPDAIAMIEAPLLSKIKIYQQARSEQIDQLRARYKELGINAVIKPFFANIPDLLEKSDLVISRSGASSIAELAASGSPSLMLPLSIAMDNHQKANATQMEQVGGGYCLDEATVSPAFLATRIMQLFEAPEHLRVMAKNATALASPAAANDIADLAESLIIKQNLTHPGAIT
ncbi:UDP-N-acetylglucosamine--N-acetylmuramyl-(pentapeptide) pyrophosphoryl-undecaprenol N-acetylglucosamine transferase [Candidatus Puniceispirillum sp.]|nr:UDP-N-acetylglucosamine--N-acetylmuramyl-(pentapeptide) pyrophosphoryl-undecaprenol N-acetylglucosamine transferase [Candidatus Puniceispirillum sp.]